MPLRTRALVKRRQYFSELACEDIPSRPSIDLSSFPSFSSPSNAVRARAKSSLASSLDACFIRLSNVILFVGRCISGGKTVARSMTIVPRWEVLLEPKERKISAIGERWPCRVLKE